MMTNEEPETKSIFCLIVGGGMGGVSLAQALLRKNVLKRDEFLIFDKNLDFGGVWKSNKYPGVACDIPSHGYVMRYSLNSDWSMKYSPGLEIQQYYATIAQRVKLQDNTHFNTEVITASWDESKVVWRVLVKDLASGGHTVWLARVLFDCGGGFHRPTYAKIPGRDQFKGEQWHTALWPDDAKLDGKRVAIIGTGPSATQVAPRIQPIVKKLYIYQRSPGHVLPRNNSATPTWVKLLFRYCYPILWLYHMFFCFGAEMSKPMWFAGSKMNKSMEANAMAHLEAQVKDPGVRERLRPTVPFGCKRPKWLDDWYPIFNQPNVELVTEKPVAFTENGLISKNTGALSEKERLQLPAGAYQSQAGAPQTDECEREFDVLIWGTGFDMNDWGGKFQIIGRDGVELSKLWGDDPKAYWGVAVSGFPNLFLCTGPNSGNYWSSITTVLEIQVNYHCKMIRHIKKRSRKGSYAVQPKVNVQKQYTDWLRANQGQPAFLAPNCSTYHKSPSGATPMHNHYRMWNTWWKLLWPEMEEFDEIHG